MVFDMDDLIITAPVFYEDTVERPWPNYRKVYHQGRITLRGPMPIRNNPIRNRKRFPTCYNPRCPYN